MEIPEAVAKDALIGIAMIQNGYSGGVETGRKRAVQLGYDKKIDIETLRVMRNWFARHVHTSYPGYLKWKADGSPTNFFPERKDNYRGAVAWLIWGGTPAYNWINSSKVQKELDKNFPGKNNKLLKL